MRSKDIVFGEYYKLKDTSMGYIKPLEILKPKQTPNINNYIVVKCEHTANKDDNMGFVRYFKLSDIIKI